jgi:hypothetical protein
LVVAASAFAGNLSIPDMSGEKGSTVEIPVNVGNAAGVAGFQITVNYDSSVLDCTQAASGNLTGGWSVTAKTEKGKVNVGGFSPALSGLSGSGNLAKIMCNVIGDSPKKSEVKISSKKLVDSKGSEIKSSGTNGIFKVKKGKGK